MASFAGFPAEPPELESEQKQWNTTLHVVGDKLVAKENVFKAQQARKAAAPPKPPPVFKPLPGSPAFKRGDYVDMTLDKGSVPGPIQGMLGSEPMRVTSRIVFFRDLFDEAHKVEFTSKNNVLGEKLAVAGSCWLEETAKGACQLHKASTLAPRSVGSTSTSSDTSSAASSSSSTAGFSAKAR